VRPLGVIYRRGRDLSATTEQFIEMLCSQPPADEAPVEDRAGDNDMLTSGNGHAATNGAPATNGTDQTATAKTVTARAK
jgi:hypothetical protein